MCMERSSKGEFHVLVKELKVFNHDFFLTKVVPRIMKNSFHREAFSQETGYV